MDTEDRIAKLKSNSAGIEPGTASKAQNSPAGRGRPQIGLIGYVLALRGAAFVLFLTLGGLVLLVYMYGLPRFTAVIERSTITSPVCGSWHATADPYVGSVRGGYELMTAISDGDIWVLDDFRQYRNELLMHRWDGRSWQLSEISLPGGASGSFNAISALSKDDIWAVGYTSQPTKYEPLIMHWDGTDWTAISTPSAASGGYLTGVEAIAPDDVWAVGDNALTMHWDGSSWTTVPIPDSMLQDSNLKAVSAFSANDVWALGDWIHSEALAVHWDGKAWSWVPTRHYGNLEDIVAISANDVWAVGSDYTAGPGTNTLIMHWNGTSWSVIPSPNSSRSPDNYLHGVAASGPDDVWAVGSAGSPNGDTLVLHWDGVSWSIVPSPTPMNQARFDAVAVTPGGNVLVAGGAEYHEDGKYFPLVAHFQRVPCPAPTGSITRP
jgi:hypothetical protein